ncbi:MAG: phenylalanine--tRNA ligase subunit alpha [Candidatus Omnitrophica bacterium]|nr:phenylalanine--tRNA ligase subunit alpha [Candidatus Omnitrophota bacterium]MBI2495502.1 phenylalanine--tRNA ligase subunit alpha [Candidatus Omnitrophota bacterium]MBI3021072.1 phenylalanine--tRNA ligase subunit alpha [Candidatus Omnitrophota bacterium]
MDPVQELEQLLSEAVPSVEQARSPDELERLRVKFVGRKSRLADIMKSIPQLAPEERAEVGRRANHLKRSIESQLAARREALSSAAKAGPLIDVSLPGRAFPRGRLHPVTHTIDAILSIFVPMGFEIVEGPEVEYEYYNFDALNIPHDHPSRESFDTFFVDLPSPEPKKGRLLLRSHTSPVQIRVMERRKPPLRLVVPGKVYRPDPLDPSHSFMFHQVEGLMVDDRTSFADLKGVIEHFLKALFGAKTKTRFRPHYFPFTEPSAEVDIACTSCGGRGCSTCGKKGWLEIMGCGMVHPNVFRAVGYDPQRVQGFAFGMGVERIAMLKHGITDIRLFFENDLRFLEQF